MAAITVVGQNPQRALCGIDATVVFRVCGPGARWISVKITACRAFSHQALSITSVVFAFPFAARFVVMSIVWPGVSKSLARLVNADVMRTRPNALIARLHTRRRSSPGDHEPSAVYVHYRSITNKGRRISMVGFLSVLHTLRPPPCGVAIFAGYWSQSCLSPQYIIASHFFPTGFRRKFELWATALATKTMVFVRSSQRGNCPGLTRQPGTEHSCISPGSPSSGQRIESSALPPSAPETPGLITG